MKRTVTTIICIVWFAASFAQDVPKLVLPATPAFSILNFEPSAIMRPANVKALSTDLLGAFDKDGKFLPNLGIEVTPYWMKNHPNLTQQSYRNPDLGQTIIRSLSISAATVKDSVSGRNQLGTGVRFKLSEGHTTESERKLANEELKRRQLVIQQLHALNTLGDLPDDPQGILDAIKEQLNAASVKVKLGDKVITEVMKIASDLMASQKESKVNAAEFLTELNSRFEADTKDLAKKVHDLLYQRKGLIIEVAGAAAFDTDGGHKGPLRTGAWASASYLVSPGDYLTLTGRYSRRSNDSSVTNADLGVGYLKQSDTYNIGLEAMLRHYRAGIPDINSAGLPIRKLEEQTTWRVAFQASYRINDYISFNASFGKDFDSAFIKRSGMFSIFGVSYNLFSKEVEKL